MADSSAIDNAIVAKLLADAPLLALMPDGVFWDEARPGATRFVIVSMIEGDDIATFEGRAIESVLYMVKAVALSTTGGDVRGAAARIDTVLEDNQLVVEGYTWMTTHREGRRRATEVDGLDPSLRWQHRGGLYRVEMSLPGTAQDTGWIQLGWWIQ